MFSKKILSLLMALTVGVTVFFMPMSVQASAIYKGVDVYEYDNISDYQALKDEGISIIIQKATQGLYHNDSLLQYRYNTILNNGFKIGFYHFANNSGQPIAEAQHFLSQISGLHSDTVLWLDIENQPNWTKEEAIDYVNKFVGYVQSQGYKIGIYTGLSFYYEYLDGNIGNVPIWLASYGKQPSQFPNTVSWQYTESGSLNGVIGDIDIDYFNDSIFTGTIPTVELSTLGKQIQSLQYDLNLDYNAKLLTDGQVGTNTLLALQGIQPLLIKGSKSHVVEWIQQKLVQYGYLKSGSYTPMLLDKPTFQAITNLQKNWGRSTSGQMDLSTWSIFLNN